MQDIDFSIVIPAYNNLELFRYSLDSVRKQKNVSFQIIVVDDSDKNRDIEEYIEYINDTHIVYSHNTPSLGAVRNWNFGLNKAEGKNVVLLHHDESFGDELFLYRIKEAMTKYDIVISNVIVKSVATKTYRLFPTWVKKYALRMPSTLFLVNSIGPCAVVAFKRKIQEKIDERIHWFVDVDWYYRMMKGHRICYLNDNVIVSHHGHQNQITNTIDVIGVSKADAIIINEKYSNKFSIALFMWVQIYVLHNPMLHKILRIFFRR